MLPAELKAEMDRGVAAVVRLKVPRGGDDPKKGADGRAEPVWLAPERLANRNWWLAGPYPYGDHAGFFDPFPPERGFDAGKRGAGGGFAGATPSLCAEDGRRHPLRFSRRKVSEGQSAVPFRVT